MVIAELLGGPQVIKLFATVGQEAQQVLKSEVRSMAIMLAGYVKTNKLSGDPLHVRTGRLRRSITFRVDTDGTRISGIVGTNVEYGRAWELGFDRRVGAGARGGPKSLKSEKARFRYIEKHPAGMKHYPERSFLRSALNELGPGILQDLEAAVRRAIR